MNEALTAMLLSISNALLIPDVIALLVLGMFTFHEAGSLAAEGLSRVRSLRGTLRGAPANANDSAAGPHEDRPAIGPVLARMRARITAGEDVDKVLDDHELRVERMLARLQLGVRLGPVLGLAGTLIPLGPALVALADGDVATLSSRLIVSFTTTVLGLAVGAACFVLHLIRRGWCRQDLSDIEHALRGRRAAVESER